MRSCRRDGSDALIWPGWSQEGLYLKNVLGEVFGRFRRAAQSAQRELVGPRRAAQPKINTAWKQSCQRPELLGDDVGCMVGKHDAAPADANGSCSCCDMANHNGRRGARNARHVVVFGHPNPAIAPGLGVDRDIPGVVERAPRIGVFGDADEIEDRQCCHEIFRTKQRAS